MLDAGGVGSPCSWGDHTPPGHVDASHVRCCRRPDSLSAVHASCLCPQLGKKERTLQEVTSPPALQRGHSSSDLLPAASLSDGSMTPRSRGEEAPSMQQLGGSQGRPAWQRQPSNLGRSSSSSGAAAGADGGSRRAVPRLALPGRQ